jgi:hypothetical protein
MPYRPIAGPIDYGQEFLLYSIHPVPYPFHYLIVGCGRDLPSMHSPDQLVEVATDGGHLVGLVKYPHLLWKQVRPLPQLPPGSFEQMV